MAVERTEADQIALATVVAVSTRPTPRRHHALRAATVGLLLALTGCAADAPQDTWKPAGKYARSIDKLQKPIFAVAGLVLVLVCAAVTYCVVKFRNRPGHDSVPHQSHGNEKVEIGLTALSAAILLCVAVPTVNVLLDISPRANDTAIEVTVIGQQWWWEYQYTSPGLEGIVTSTELVLPIKTKVRLNITSRDVIHSYWIPKLNGKKDAVPNRVQPLNLEASVTGIFEGQCTEFCGLSHANMRQRVVALEQADFDKWVANQKTTAKNLFVKGEKEEDRSMAAKGQAQFIAQCARCHEVAGLVDDKGEAVHSKADEQLVAGAAPNLTHLMSRSVFAGGMFNLKGDHCTAQTAPFVTGTPDACINRPDLEAWLRNAPAQKPMFAVQNADKLYRGMPNLNLSEAQIDELVAYLGTLK